MQVRLHAHVMPHEHRATAPHLRATARAASTAPAVTATANATQLISGTEHPPRDDLAAHEVQHLNHLVPRSSSRLLPFVEGGPVQLALGVLRRPAVAACYFEGYDDCCVKRYPGLFQVSVLCWASSCVSSSCVYLLLMTSSKRGCC